MNTMTQCFNVAVENIDDMEAEGSHSLHSSGQTPENAEFSSEMRTDSAGCTKEEDKAVFEDIQEVNQSYQCVQPVEERPWRKSGADISDYFNYGFDEESWKAYCRKHARLQTFQSHIAKVTREQAKYEEEGSRPSSTSGRSSKRSGRQRKANSTGSGGKAGSSSSSRKKARPCCSDAARDTQVVAGISHKEKNVTNYDLPRSINVCTVFSFVPPPSSLFQFYQSMSSTSMLDSGKLGNFDEPSTSLNPYFVGNMATDSAVIDAANAWECYLQQKRDRDRDRSGEHGHDKRRRRRCRDRGKQSSSSSHNSGRKQMNHRESMEHVYKRRRTDGASGKKKQKEEKDGSQKPSQSRSSNFSGKDDRKKRSSQKKGKDGGRPQKATLPAKMEN